MLFASEAVLAARKALFAEMAAGAITEKQGLVRALELDAYDIVALLRLAAERYDAGDLAPVEQYSWRAAIAEAWQYEPWFKLAACAQDEGRAYVDGFLELGALKAVRDPANIARFARAFGDNPATQHLASSQEDLEDMADGLCEKRREEPPEVSDRLRPYRLIDDVLVTADEGVDADLVDEILADGARCLPPLMGILRAMANGSLPAGNERAIVSAMALIGEIGDPALLPELIECYMLSDAELRAAAQWAVHRIASRQAGLPGEPVGWIGDFPRPDRDDLFMPEATVYDLCLGVDRDDPED